MSTTITGKMNKAASQFQAGESTGFGLRVGVQYYDRETKTQQWTNYEAVVFAKAPSQIQFYQQVLIEGAIVEITGDKQRIRQFQGANGLQLSIEILDPKLGYVGMSAAPQNRPPAPPVNQPPQAGYNQAPQAGYNQAPQAGYNQAPQQPAYNQAPQQQNYQQQQAFNQPRPAEPNIDFDDDIPF